MVNLLCSILQDCELVIKLNRILATCDLITIQLIYRYQVGVTIYS